MKKLLLSLICCVSTLGFAGNCPDPSTIVISNHKITAPSGYIASVISVIAADSPVDFRTGVLITRIIDPKTVEIKTEECTYRVGDDESNYGYFMLNKYFIDIEITDEALKQHGWEPQNRRKWFKCEGSNANLCEY